MYLPENFFCPVKVSDIWGKVNLFYVLCSGVGSLNKPTLFLSILEEVKNKHVLCSLIRFPKAPKRIRTMGLEGR